MIDRDEGYSPGQQNKQHPTEQTKSTSVPGLRNRTRPSSTIYSVPNTTKSNPYRTQTQTNVVTSSGKRYTLDSSTTDWIKNRFKRDWEGTYGYDDEDKLAQKNGQMSAAVRKTYGDSNVDRDLAAMGLPSEKYLESYIEDYNRWHTGGISDVFGEAVSSEAWTKIKDLYKQDWAYGDTAEDQRRKARGLMPTALAAKYTDTELDDDLQARGLPSAAEMAKYAGRYNNYLGIDGFYRNVAGEWTNLRLRGFKNDDEEYTDEETGVAQTGSKWYADAFFGELDRKGDDGKFVYDGIRGLFKPRTATAEIDPEKDYVAERGKAFAAGMKADSTAEDYARYDAFSYDDFASKYDGYYQQYYAGADLGDGYTVAKALDEIAMREDKRREKAFYTVTSKHSDSIEDPSGVDDFVKRYQDMYPTATPGQMFADMFAHGIADKFVKEAMRQLQAGKSGQEARAIGTAYYEARTENQATEQTRREQTHTTELSSFEVVSGVERYMTEHGGITADNVTAALAYYDDLGVPRSTLERAKKELIAGYSIQAMDGNMPGFPEISTAVGGYTVKNNSSTSAEKGKDHAASLAAYIKARKEETADTDTVNQAMTIITDSIDGVGDSVSPDVLFGIAKGVANQGWAGAGAARRALVDLGFSMDGDFTGSAAMWAEGWTNIQKTTFLNRLRNEMHTLDDVEDSNDKPVTLSGNTGYNWSGYGQSQRAATTPSDTAAFSGGGAGHSFGGIHEIGDVEYKPIEAYGNLTDEGRAAIGGSVLSPSVAGSTGAVLAGVLGKKKDGSYSIGEAMSNAEDMLIDAFSKGDGIPLDVGEYEIVREWMQEQVASGEMTELEAFNAACALGYQDEIEAYDSEAFHAAIYKERYVPQYFEAEKGEQRAFWDEASDEEKAAIANDMWDDLGVEGQAEVFKDYNWKLDPGVYRTAGQTWGQQFLAVLPTVATSIASGAIGTADMIGTWVTGKDELWDVTQRVVEANDEVVRFGNVTDNINGSAIARIASDATSEMVKMYVLGSIGGGIGEAFGSATGLSSIAAGSTGSAAVQKIAGFALDFIKASPFVVSAIGNGFEEAKMLGAGNGEATAYALVTGTLEGVLEGLNFDKLWGNVLGQEAFGKMLWDGANIWRNAGVVAKARVINMLVAGLGETTEETASYLAETFWKIHSDWLGGSGWGKDTEWSAKEWAEQAGMGFLTGLLGAGISAGSINEGSILQDYYESNGRIKGSVLDYAVAKSWWDNASEADQEKWRNGSIKAKSLSEFANLMMQLDIVDEGKVASAVNQDLKKLQTKWDGKVDNAQKVVDGLRGKLAALDANNSNDAMKIANLTNQLSVAEITLENTRAERDAAIAKATAEGVQRILNAKAQRSDIQAALAEHYAAVYLRNESAANARDYDTLNANHARARQNGDTVDLTAETEKTANSVDNLVDVAASTGYNNSINQEDSVNGREAGVQAGTAGDAGEAAPGGDAGVSEPAGTIDNQVLPKDGGDGRADHRWIESVPVIEKAKAKGIEPIELRTDNNDPSSFYAAIGDAKTNNAYGAFVTQHEVAEYEGMRTFLNDDGGVGVGVTKDGNIVSVFKNPEKNKGRMASSSILFTALESGGVKLDNFNSNKLSNIYLQHGFIPVARTAFVDEFAPSDWNYERDGRPDIIFWVHNGDSVNAVLDKLGTYEMPAIDSIPMYEDYDAAEAARDAYLEERKAQQAEPTQSEIRTLTDAEVAGIRRIVRDIGYRGNVVFIDDPDADDASFAPDGTVTINRANITGAEADKLANNPGFWLLKHEWTHFIEGVDEYAEYSAICRRIMQTRLSDAGYVNAKQRVTDDYAVRGVELTPEMADREMVAKFGESDELFSNQETIDMFVREQKGIASRFYNWLQYKINDMKLRRKKDSAVAREILKAERLYAQAFRKANTRPTRDTRSQAIQYAIRSFNGNQYVQADRAVFTSDNVETRRVQLENYLNDMIGEKGRLDIPTADGDMISIIDATQSDYNSVGKLSSVEEYVDQDTGALDADGARLKQNAALHIDEIVEVSKAQAQRENFKEKHAEHAQKGWTYRQAFFRDYDGKYYKLTISIPESSNGKFVYNVNQFWQRSDPTRKTSQIDGSSLSGAPLSGGSTNYNTQNGQIVNTQNSTRRATGSSWNDLVQQYGAKPQGMNPRTRDIQVPERVSEDKRVSDFARSFLESNKAADDMVADLQQRIADGDWMSYTQLSNQEAMDRARSYIAQRQITQAQAEFHDMVKEGKFGTKTNAIGLQLLAEAANRGDKAAVLDIATDLQLLATEAGQSVQIFSALKELGGVGSAWYMQKVVDRLNAKYSDQIADGKMLKITVDPALMQQLAEAQTTAEITKAEEAVAKYIGEQIPLTFTDRASNWRYFSMLANPTTHFRNITGNVLMAGLNTAKDAVATGVEKALGVKQGDRAHAILAAKDRSTWSGFAQASFEDQQRNLQGGGKLGFETFVKQNMRSFDTKWLNALAKFNFNALEGEDLAFIRPAYKNALMQYMKAQGYTLNEKGEAGKNNVKGEFTAITQAQMNAAVEWASNQAWKATFRDASSLATMLNKISKMNAVSRLLVEGVMPFKKTPINIAKRGIEYSPAGIIMGIAQLTNGVKKGKVTTAQAIDNLSSGITGTALMALGMFLAKAGVIRAGGDDKKKYETYLEDTGDQTYSLKFGDVSINMSAIAPATIPLFMGVALMEALDRNGDSSFDLSTFTDTMAGTLNPFMEMSFMSSLNSALQNYNNEGIGGALGNTLLTAAQNYGSQYLPTLGSKIGQFLDSTRRTTKSDATSPVGGNMDYYWRSLVKKVPGAEASLQPDVDVWGRTDTKDSFGDWALDFANKFILPTNVKITNRDSVDKELIRIVESTGSVDFLPSDGNKYFTVSGQKYTMNARQYTQYSQERGQAAYAALKDTMASASYRSASDEEKAAMLKKALDNAYKVVNNSWKEKLGAYDK